MMPCFFGQQRRGTNLEARRLSTLGGLLLLGLLSGARGEALLGGALGRFHSVNLFGRHDEDLQDVAVVVGEVAVLGLSGLLDEWRGTGGIKR